MEFQLNALWVMIGAILVIFMQGGFIMLETGSTRMKNAGHVAGKTIFTIGLAAIIYWMIGWGIAYGPNGNLFIGLGDFFYNPYNSGDDLPNSVSFVFQFAFAAISLSIAWGGFAERGKLPAYLLFTIVFIALIYPMVAHWIWGDGFLAEDGAQDFAGSTVVHLTGAMAALAATILLKPRIGKFNKDGSANNIQGHNQVFTTLGVLILWVGWFGFNGASTLGVDDTAFFGYVAFTTLLATGAGAIVSLLTVWALSGKADIGTMLNGTLAGLVAITASCAFVDPWAAVVIGAIAGALVYASMRFFEKMKIDDPIYALSVHGAAGIWGTLANGLFATEELAVNQVGVGQAGLFYGGGWKQLWVQFESVVVCGIFAFVVSFVALLIIKALVGLRVTEEQEIMGLDLSEHGSYGYPEHMTNSGKTTGVNG
ncbi:ammonium transporter [Xylanibacillus composti]|uniref:Ammonium transporter n=1 Tax=Xylanibacillus composti TaxID=1572762 RepID=A0A8J4H3X0_9BACL|nr:ammonium transporter [Xylanibacillus composti]GIQ68213.1 ammonium transporter [Xylanibacillus composti]